MCMPNSKLMLGNESHDGSFDHRPDLAGADIRAQSGSYGGEKGGEMTVDAGGQHVLERTSVLINSQVYKILITAMSC